MGKYTKRVAEDAGGFEDDGFKYIVAEALDEIITRLERMENETKPRARIDEGYKTENTQKNQKGDTNGTV